MTTKLLFAYTQAIVTEVIYLIARFPFWWYGRGVVIMLQWGKDAIYGTYQFLALGIWIRNLFVPMFGDVTIPGRLISFGVRLFMIGFKTIGLLVFSVLIVLVILIYLITIPVCVFGLFFHGTGLLLS